MKRICMTFVVQSLLCVGGPLIAQEIKPATTEEQNIDAYISLLRQDIQSQAVAIIGQMMQFTPEQASAFWPVYAEYSKELQRIGDLRVANIKDYAANYGSITDQKAEELVMKALEFQTKRLELKKQFFSKFAKALSPKLAAKFFQVEHQLQLILDLQISAELPVVD